MSVESFVLIAIVIIGWARYSKQKQLKSDAGRLAPPHFIAPAPIPGNLDPATTLSSRTSGGGVVEPTIAYAFVDLETTGLDRENDRITEICVVVFTHGATTHYEKSTLVNPGRPLSPFITNLTGITNEMLADKPGEECLRDYFDLIGEHTVYAYNAKFDIGFLQAAARRLGVTFTNRSECVMERVKAVHPNLRSYKLTDVCTSFGIDVAGDAHRAEGDVRRAFALLSAVNRGEKPAQSSVGVDINSPNYGVYGHFTTAGVLFYVWTARNGEPTTPGRDQTWSGYVENQLRGEYEIRCIKDGITMSAAISVKDQYLADHPKTLLNRINPHRGIVLESYEAYEELKASWSAYRNKAKELEISDPKTAIAYYQRALCELNQTTGLVLEEGLYGQIVAEMNRQAPGGDALKILDRISLLLCKAKRHHDADAAAKDVFEKYPRLINSKGAQVIMKRIAKGIKHSACFNVDFFPLRGFQMNPDLLRQRRNSMIASAFLLVFDFAKLKISQVSLLGTELMVGDPQFLEWSAWVLWWYFLLRYYQYLRAEPCQYIRDTFAQKIDVYVRAHTGPTNTQDAIGQPLCDPEVVRAGLASWAYQRPGSPPPASVGEKVIEVLPAFRMGIWWIKAAAFVCIQSPHGNDRILPFVLALAACLKRLTMGIAADLSTEVRGMLIVRRHCYTSSKTKLDARKPA